MDNQIAREIQKHSRQKGKETKRRQDQSIMAEQQPKQSQNELSQFEVMEIVGTTWDDIKKIPNYVEIAGALLFKK